MYRVLLTGIHLMRTGQVEANLLTLNEDMRLPFIPDLVARKVAGPSNRHSRMRTLRSMKVNTRNSGLSCSLPMMQVLAGVAK